MNGNKEAANLLYSLAHKFYDDGDYNVAFKIQQFLATYEHSRAQTIVAIAYCDIEKQLKYDVTIDLQKAHYYAKKAIENGEEDVIVIFEHIESLLEKQSESLSTAEHLNTQTNSEGVTAESLTKRGFIFLDDLDMQQAKIYFERALDIDPEYAKAYIGKLCVELNIRKETDLYKSL